MLLSGRIARYEVCLLPLLQSTTHTIDLFVSINGTPSLYTEQFQVETSPWLKWLRIEPFVFPSEFEYTHPWTYAFQERDGCLVPFNQMSMYFNDGCAFRMATAYADSQGFEYDLYMKFRADICNAVFPDVFPISPEKVLFSAHAPNQFTTSSLYKVPVISDAYAWGNRNTMEIYCATYDFVLQTLAEMKGNYRIAFEDCVADCLLSYDVAIQYERSITYHLDMYRRLFETHKNKDHFPYLHNEILNYEDTLGTYYYPNVIIHESKPVEQNTEREPNEDSATS